MNARTSLFSVAFALLLIAPFSGSAQQKFGHLNSGNLLEMMPDVKVANDSLKLFGDGLNAKRDALTQNFKAALDAYQKDVAAGTLTPLQAQAREADLQKMQNEGQEFEKNMQQITNLRRQQLLDPILTKVDSAIKAVGKEGNYAMIFDTSTGSTLYALETEDVLPLVKSKLGI